MLLLTVFWRSSILDLSSSKKFVCRGSAVPVVQLLPTSMLVFDLLTVARTYLFVYLQNVSFCLPSERLFLFTFRTSLFVYLQNVSFRLPSERIFLFNFRTSLFVYLQNVSFCLPSERLFLSVRIIKNDPDRTVVVGAYQFWNKQSWVCLILAHTHEYAWFWHISRSMLGSGLLWTKIFFS